MTQVLRLVDVAPYSTVPGVRLFPIFGDNMMVNLVELDANAEVPLHSHPHEQIGVVLEGSIVMIIDGRNHELGPDDAFQIPGGVEHGAIAGPEGCRAIDVFQPVREDYRALASQ
jgi:quercetin dioxygenase-like cupin family protein